MEKIDYEYSEEGLNLSKLTRQELRKYNNKKSRKETFNKSNFKHEKINISDCLEMLNTWKQYNLPNKKLISLTELK